MVIGADQDSPLKVTAFVPAVATQKVVVEQETEWSVPPTPTGFGVDHFPLRQKSAEPLSSTATQKVLDGHDKP